MNMYAKFDEIPAMTQDIKETNVTDGRTDPRTTWKQYTHHKQSLRGLKNKVCGGYDKKYSEKCVRLGGHSKKSKNRFSRPMIA